MGERGCCRRGDLMEKIKDVPVATPVTMGNPVSPGSAFLSHAASSRRFCTRVITRLWLDMVDAFLLRTHRELNSAAAISQVLRFSHSPPLASGAWQVHAMEDFVPRHGFPSVGRRGPSYWRSPRAMTPACVWTSLLDGRTTSLAIPAACG